MNENQAQETQTNAGNTVQIIGFTLNNEEYALEINNVQEIYKRIKTTRVPRAKKYIIGVINLRGIVIPIIDLSLRFTMEKNIESENSSQRIIILKLGNISVGIIVDSVSEVIEISQNQILSNPTITSSISAEYLKGVCKLGEDRLLTLLNIEKILDIKAS